MTLDFARTFLVPIATASRIKSTRLCHRKKPGSIIRDLLTSSKQDGTHSEIAASRYSMSTNAVYDSASNTTDSDTTRTGYDEDESVRTAQSTAQPPMHLSASLASSTKSSKGFRRPGYKMTSRTSIPKLAAACKLRHTKIARTRPALTAAPAPHSASRTIRTKSAKQPGSGVAKLAGKHQRTARDTTGVGSGNKSQVSKKSAPKSSSRSSCTAVARKYGGRLECTGRFKRSLRTARSVNTKVSQTKVHRPASEPLLVQGKKILAENNSTNASEAKGCFLEVKMRDAAEKGDDSEAVCTFLTRESRLQCCDTSPEPLPELEHSLIPSEQPETPDEKQTSPDQPQTNPGQPQVPMEQPQGHAELPQGHAEQPQGQTKQPRAPPEELRGFQKTPSPSGVNLRSASMSSSRAKNSLTKTAPVVVSFPPVSAITNKESSQAEVKAAPTAALRIPCKPLTMNDGAAKHSKIKRKPSLVPATAKPGLKKAASGNKIAAEKTVPQKPRKSSTGGPIQKTALAEKTGTAPSAKTFSDANCHRSKSCARNPTLTTMAVKRDMSRARETAVTRSMKSKSEVKNLKSGLSKPKLGPESDRNANAGHGVITRNASPLVGDSARYRSDVFVSDDDNVNLNADDTEEGATRSSQRLSKKNSRSSDILNLDSNKLQRESKDVEEESETLAPADEPETAEREVAERESGTVEKVGSMQAVKGAIGSLSSQSKHVNIQEVTRAPPRVVRKKKRVKKNRAEEVKDVEPGRCPLFQGWDFGTNLEKHTMDHVPVDSDITQLLLTRTTRMLWLKAGSSFKRDLLAPLQYPSDIHTEKTDVKAYLAKHDISEHFQRITNSVLDDPKSEDPLQMMINQGNVLSRQAVYQREAERLLGKMMNKQYANPISFPSFLKTEALRQAELAESAPTAEQSVDDETEEQSDEQPTSTMDESATLTGKTSGSTNVTNETEGK